MIPRLVNVAVGVWLIFAPAVVGYGDPARANHRIVGPAIAGVAFVALWAVVRPVRWLNLGLGAWLTLSPLFLAHPGAAALVAVLSGLVVAALAPFGSTDRSRFGGGWSTLWGDIPESQYGDA